MKVNPALIDIELVQDAIITDAKLAFRPAAQSLMGEPRQAETHLIYLLLHTFTNVDW
jgi:hypothetical protein